SSERAIPHVHTRGLRGSRRSGVNRCNHGSYPICRRRHGVSLSAGSVAGLQPLPGRTRTGRIVSQSIKEQEMEYTLPSRRACGVLAAVLGLAFAGDAAAQQPRTEAPASGGQPQRPAVRLTLEQAIEIARGSNPTYLITANDEGDAIWQQREAYAAFLPSVSVSGAGQYVAEGTPNLGFLTGADLGVNRVPSSYYSSYGIEGAIELSGATL